MSKSLHPAVCVTAGFFLILWLQVMDGGIFWSLASCTLLAGICFAGTAFLRTLKRLRYIFFALFILFLWETPGTLIVPVLGNLSPSLEGLQLFFLQGMRLAGVVAVVALMLSHLSSADWVASLLVIFAPLRLIGFATERFAIRLHLVLEYVQRRELDWRQVLHEPVEALGGELQFGENEGFRFRDRGFLFAVCCCGVWGLYWLG